MIDKEAMDSLWSRFVGLTALVFALLSFFGMGIYILFFSSGHEKENKATAPTLVSIRYIDMQQVFDQSERGKQEKAEYAQQFKRRQRQLEGMMSSLKATQRRIQALAKAGKQAEAVQMVAPFQEAQKRYSEAQQQLAIDQQKAQADLNNTFTVELKTVADQIRSKEKVDVVQTLEKGKVLSIDPHLDVTSEALTFFNGQFPVKSNAKK